MNTHTDDETRRDTTRLGREYDRLDMIYNAVLRVRDWGRWTVFGQVSSSIIDRVADYINIY